MLKKINEAGMGRSRREKQRETWIEKIRKKNMDGREIRGKKRWNFKELLLNGKLWNNWNQITFSTKTCFVILLLLLVILIF